MKLQAPFIQLPLRFDASALAAEVAALGEAAWRPHPQGFAGNSMLPLVAVKGDPADETFAGGMQPTPHLKQCPYLMQTIASLGATVGRTRLMRLSGHAEVKRHADQGYYWTERVRVHVPLVTQPTVRFECGDAAINMAAGECWIFDTWRQHRVINDSVESRIHLVVDTVGGSRFWGLVGKGRPVGVPFRDAGWSAVLQTPATLPAADFACESANLPDVMSPWELNAHLGFLFGEVQASPQLGEVQQAAVALMREWRALWAQFGDAQAGRAQFRAAMQKFLTATATPAKGITLRNELLLINALNSMIGKAAVVGDHAAMSSAAGQRAYGDNA
jgi:Aspartyl/Asparaginyl beta-hydroxylase